MNVMSTAYPLMSITDSTAASTCGLWAYAVTSSTTVPANGIMLRFKPTTAVSSSTAVKTRTAGATTWTKLAVTYQAGAAPYLAINGAVSTFGTLPTGAPAAQATNAPIIRVGSETFASTLSLTALDSSVNYSISMAAKTYALDGNIMHFAYFPTALGNADLTAITS